MDEIDLSRSTMLDFIEIVDADSQDVVLAQRGDIKQDKGVPDADS